MSSRYENSEQIRRLAAKYLQNEGSIFIITAPFSLPTRESSFLLLRKRPQGFRVPRNHRVSVAERNRPAPAKGRWRNPTVPLSAEPSRPNEKFFQGEREIIREMPRFLQESAPISCNTEREGVDKQLILSQQLLVLQSQAACRDPTLPARGSGGFRESM